MYTFQSRVRYSECDSTGHLSLNALLNYLQDCSTFQSEMLGVGVERLRADHMVWVLSSWQVIVNRYPVMGEKITACTWPYGFKGFMGNRNFLLKDEKGEVVAYANTNWVFLNTETGRPVRVPQELQERYPYEPPYEMAYAERKLNVDEDMELQEAIRVQRFHIDTNQHVNNTKYVMMAEEYLPEGFKVRELRVEYKKSALLGDMIYPRTKLAEDKVVVTLENVEGVPYVIVEFLEDK